MLNTVQVPKQFELIFQKAQEYTSKYFKEKKEDPSKGTIEIFGERYILVRAASMSIDFFETIENLYKDRGEEEALNIARSFLFDIAHAIGKQDAKNFHKKMKLKDPIEKLSAGPVHFSHSGWAFVNIFPESKPTPDENFYLIYDHPFSFESDAWEKKGKRPDFPVCVMNAGYSSGWCEESFGVSLVASEITCKAKGDETCRFIMAHPSKIKGYIKEYLEEEPKLAKKVTRYEIPGFFKRKQIEDERKKAEEAVREERDRAQKYLDVAGVMFLVIGVDQKVRLINQEGCKILGYNEEDIIGKNWIENFIPERVRDEVNVVAERLSKGETEAFEYFENPVLTKSGEERIISWHNTMLRDKDGSITDALCSGQDITDSKRAEEALRQSEERLKILFESAPDAIFLNDAKGNFVDGNKTAEEMVGYAKEELIGKNVSETGLLSEEQMPKAFKHLEDIAMGKPTGPDEFTLKRKDGSYVTVEIRTFPVRIGNQTLGLGIARDITERKKSELSQNELITKVDKINRELNDFASIVSHDLKAPLRGIKTLANWILADCADKLGDQANEQINLLLDRVERMYNLIEGALQYSRLGQTKGKQIQVNLNNFVPEIINMVVPPENITVTIENELPVIEFEETQIMQVFQNLLSNAIKYMDKPKGWIKIGCVEQDGFWKFSVADNGPGIEEKHFERIFKIFQALPTSPMFEGTGVGLTITKKIVELYNGKIWVESKVGQGSTFFFTLPKQKGPRLAGTKMGAKK